MDDGNKERTYEKRPYTTTDLLHKMRETCKDHYTWSDEEEQLFQQLVQERLKMTGSTGFQGQGSENCKHDDLVEIIQKDKKHEKFFICMNCYETWCGPVGNMGYEREEFDENTLEGYLVGWKRWLLGLVNITHGGGWRYDDEKAFQEIKQVLESERLRCGARGALGPSSKENQTQHKGAKV